MEGNETKIVYDKPWYFICKRKHEEGDRTKPTTPEAPKANFPKSYIDFNHTNPNEYESEASEASFHCPECEGDEIIENQLGHSCVQRELGML